MPVKREETIWKKYFIIKAVHRGRIPDLFSSLIEDNAVYVNAKIELSSPLEMAHLESRMLANQFRDACIKRLKKRYGDQFELDVVECSTHINKTIQYRIRRDSSSIKQRLTARTVASKPL